MLLCWKGRDVAVGARPLLMLPRYERRAELQPPRRPLGQSPSRERLSVRWDPARLLPRLWRCRRPCRLLHRPRSRRRLPRRRRWLWPPMPRAPARCPSRRQCRWMQHWPTTPGAGTRMASSCCSGNRARFVYAAQVRCGAGQGGGRQRRPCDAHRQRGAARGAGQRQGGAHRHRQRAVPQALLVEPAERRAADEEAGLAVPQHAGGTYVVTPGGHRVTLSTRGRVAVLMCAGPERVMLRSRGGPPASRSATQTRGRSWCGCTRRLSHMGWTRMMRTAAQRQGGGPRRRRRRA